MKKLDPYSVLLQVNVFPFSRPTIQRFYICTQHQTSANDVAYGKNNGPLIIFKGCLDIVLSCTAD